MTVYAELLRLALAQQEQPERSIDELAAAALAQREALTRADALVRRDVAATRLGVELAYDCTLVRLCGQLGVNHDLLGDTAGPVARRRTERALTEALQRSRRQETRAGSVTLLLRSLTRSLSEV